MRSTENAFWCEGADDRNVTTRRFSSVPHTWHTRPEPLHARTHNVLKRHEARKVKLCVLSLVCALGGAEPLILRRTRKERQVRKGSSTRKAREHFNVTSTGIRRREVLSLIHLLHQSPRLCRMGIVSLRLHLYFCQYGRCSNCAHSLNMFLTAFLKALLQSDGCYTL